MTLHFTHNSATMDNKPEGDFVWLQSIGWVSAKPLANLVPNVDYVMYNQGGSALVTAHIESARGKVVGIMVQSSKDGKVYESRRRATTLIPFGTMR
jgi:hypothetical protein